jgi:hypothetical protein
MLDVSNFQGRMFQIFKDECFNFRNNYKVPNFYGSKFQILKTECFKFSRLKVSTSQS